MLMEFEAKLSNLHRMIDWIRMQTDTSSFSSFELRKFEIAIEEALVNIIRHAYRENNGKIIISVAIESEKVIEVKIEDFGVPFNPIEKRKPIDRELPLEKREVGGLGLSFMHEFMDEIIYERQGGKNLLILRKFIPDR